MALQLSNYNGNREQWLKACGRLADSADLEGYGDRLAYALVENEYLHNDNNVTISVRLDDDEPTVKSLLVIGPPGMFFGATASELSAVFTKVGVELGCHAFQLNLAYPPGDDGIIIRYKPV